MNTINNLPLQETSKEVLSQKYLTDHELDQFDVYKRVSTELASVETDPSLADTFFKALSSGFVPAGRILSNAGLARSSTTLINCFVQPISDQLSGFDVAGVPSIYAALDQSGVTMKSGGGVGYNFSAIRPSTSVVTTTSSRASGPLSFMKVFDSSCQTLASAGARRGAQMAVLNVSHPDIVDFISAKDKSGELTNFNMSVGSTDAFMEAVVDGGMWDLVHKARPNDELIEQGAYYCDDRSVWVYQSVKASDLYDQIMQNTYNHAEPGFLCLDTINRTNNLHYCETLDATNPCGEQPLPAYGSCCLGSVNLTKYVRNPFTSEASFDFEMMYDVAATAVRMLDNVLSVTNYPLEEQKYEAMQKRRIGLGFTGLGDALVMQCIHYDSKEAISFAEKMSEGLRNAAYLASIELAKEKGAFPLFDAKEYLKSGFAKELPDHIVEQIRQHGIRNSHLLSIAPTGTISLSMCDNASNGIEPAFSWSYDRVKRCDDGTKVVVPVEDHAYRLYRHLGHDMNTLPDYFVSALELPVSAHLNMLVTVQKYIDTSISKTVNIPVDYDFDDFKALYVDGWRRGLKGIATFRPNDVTGSVLIEKEDSSDDPSKVQDLDTSDPDTRIKLEKVPQMALNSLRWQKRPTTLDGCPSMTYMVEHPTQGSFSLFISHIENGSAHPFEIWLNGAEQPRLLGALAKNLSIDMRSMDREFLKLKLDTLASVSDYPFEMHIPGRGPSRLPGIVSALSAIVSQRCNDLGIFDTPTETPLLDSLMSKKEPKSGPDGTMSWTVDVVNHTTSDDFVLGVKELDLDGIRTPYGLFVSGNYPRYIEGLLASLSIDCRVMDPAWIGKKLVQLLDYAEPLGDFFTRVPGSEKSKNYPSTVAYIAALLIHRYERLGILDSDGKPLRTVGALAFDLDLKHENTSDKTPVMHGKKCPECSNHSLIKRDGCDFCTSCGHIGSCG